ncbi:MAG TPA: DNA gyrase subunit A [Candidatus Thermoplasmatota archaeon]|nr:DNA gyrase subunit A [Candidatus Thermoplasmatota archaeon]
MPEDATPPHASEGSGPGGRDPLKDAPRETAATTPDAPGVRVMPKRSAAAGAADPSGPAGGGPASGTGSTPDGGDGPGAPKMSAAGTLSIVARPIEQEMRQSFLDYAMSVIVSRALPDARDGLKPVHRRILYAMGELSLTPDRAYRKSALVVGDVLGKYHPHGDTSVYDAMVRMAQDWNLRYPLVDGQGNFGSVDGDGAAAMRYTEARLTRPAMALLADLDKETVAMAPNYDSSREEPTVLPAAIPNLLVNGSAGIAVGMATNVPPHNLGEVIDACVRIIDNPATTALDLLSVVRGPDFPTGGIILGRSGIASYLTTGRGRVVVRAKHHIEESGDRERLVFTEIPYQVNKSQLLIQIAELAKDKVVEGISDLRDESDRRGMRVVIELKRDAIPDVVLNQLWKHTTLQQSFVVNNLALVDGRPRTLGVRELLQVFLQHRFVVVTKRTEYDLRKAEARAHLLEGLLIALANIDAVVALIRASADADAAREGLMSRFSLTDVQAKAILEMRLQRLTSLETDEVRQEHATLTEQIAYYRKVLGDPQEVYRIIREELLRFRAEFADERRTQISEAEADIDDESLIPEEESVFLFTSAGYLKRMPIATWRQQRRGGKGKRGLRTKEEDEVVEVTVGSTHDYLCFFTNQGRVHWLKGYRVPTGSAQAKGKPVVNLLALEPNELVETIIPVRDFGQPAAEGEPPGPTLFFATKKGTVKRTALSDFRNVRAAGIIAINLDPGDELLAVRLTNGAQEVILATKMGQACRFEESQVRVMGRATTGVRGITLEDGDEVVSLAIAEPGTSLLSVTANGFGKRTELEEYRKTNRGAKGVRTIIVNERNGPVVAVRTVHGDESLLVITRMGMVVRTRVEEVRETGRSAQGVRIVSMEEGDAVTQVAVLPPEEGEGVPEGGLPPAGAPPGELPPPSGGAPEAGTPSGQS